MKLTVPMLLALGTVVSCGLSARAEDAAAAAPAETPEQRDARMAWWRDARFGMFIHWGLYAVPAGTWDGKRVGGIGEWIMNKGKIPVADYAKFAGQFNPTKFDADEWVQLAKDAGQKYIVITAKHHDGFAMYHSKVDAFNIYDATPFKRDPLAELAAACEKAGVKLGFYYSQDQDWHHPGGGAYGGHWDKAQDGDFDAYLRDVAVPQVRELLTNYKPFPAVLWFDTPKDMTKERAALFLPLLRLQPGLIVNNRLGGGFKGDTETPEQKIPATGYPPGRDWETCMTINDTWGYKSYDDHFKNTEKLLRNLIDIASKGGNYLLNVGPTAEGVIPEPEAQRLREVGAWLKVNGEAIYGTSASPFAKLGFDGRCTRKGNMLYLHVFNWPAEGIVLKGLKTPVREARLLDGNGQVQFTPEAPDGAAGLRFPPPAKLDPIATVLKLTLEGPPEVEAPPAATTTAPATAPIR